MRLRILPLLTLLASVVLVSASAWSKEDYEIFKLHDEVEAAEGPGVTFYDFVGVKPSATVAEIIQAVKKRSRVLHPDKARHSFVASRSTGKPKKPGEKRQPGVQVTKGPSQREIEKFVKTAKERYQRLTVVASILRGPDRERYDFFLRHGFPRWRGTGYYYNRYRPGLGTVLVGLFLVGGGAAHYLILVTNYKRQKEFMERYIKHARKTAWGDDAGLGGIPGLNGSAATASAPVAQSAEDEEMPVNLNRRQKREFERQNKKDKTKGASKGRSSGTSTPQRTTAPVAATSERRRVTAENGKILVVDSIGNVFLEEEDEEGNTEEFLLDLNEIQKPSVRDTALFRVPVWLYRKAFDPFLKPTQPVPSDSVPLTESEEKRNSPKIKREEDVPVVSIETVMPASASDISTPTAATTASDMMSASQQDLMGYEMVDSSTGIESEMAASSAAVKRKHKKGKK